MYKITSNHDGLHTAQYDGDDFQINIPIVVHCESQEEAREIAAAITEQFGDGGASD